MLINKNNLLFLRSQSENAGKFLPDHLFSILYPKSIRGKQLTIRLINFYLMLIFKFKNVRLFHSLDYLAKMFRVNPNYLCKLLKDLVDIGILSKSKPEDVRTAEYFLSPAFKLPEVRYRLADLFPALKGMALSLLFCTPGYGAETDVKRLSNRSDGGDLNLYSLNYEDIIKGVLKDTEKIGKKKQDMGKIQSVMYQALNEIELNPKKVVQNIPDFSYLQILEPAVLAGHRDYVINSLGDIPFYSVRKQPRRNKYTPKAILEADYFCDRLEQQKQKVLAEIDSEEAARKNAIAAENLRKLFGPNFI